MWIIGALTKVMGMPEKGDSASEPDAMSYAAAVFIYVYAVGFCFSWAGVPWVLCSEIFPLQVRGLGMAICTATHWLFNFVIARSVPYMISNIKFGTYFVFASFITVSIPFVWFMVPETKGLKLEEMDEIFNGSGLPGRRRIGRGASVAEDEKVATTQVEHV